MRELEELRVERFFEANEVDRLGRWLHVDVFGADRIALSSIQDVVHARETNHSEVIVDAVLLHHLFCFDDQQVAEDCPFFALLGARKKC